MKRTNLVLDEQLLKEATRESGLKTYSATVNRALEEFLRMRKVQSIPQYFGKLRWHGNLSEMREDTPLPRRRRKKTVQ
jgi:Arc/MetJ family transcription regulator